MLSKSVEVKGVGVILGYRRGSNTQYVNQVLIKVFSSKLKNVSNLIGCKVLVKDGHGNEYRGKVVRIHARGRNNVVIAVFNRNLPGQTIGAEAIFYG
ncbi:MAG TPA: 50S ribosomal protein L35ae [Acidilobales archaeon]|nr:50S ribosomal protein L35ae [Acidilobales archaeon]